MATSTAPGLARKVNKTLEIKTESADIFAALATLSGFYAENTNSNRRGLKATIEGRLVSINEEYLSSASPLIQALEGVQQTLDSLRDECRQAKQTIAHAQDSSAGLLSSTDRLQRDLHANEKRTTMVQQFLQNYQLTPGEVKALQAPEIGEEFFSALSRVRSIHSNCKALLRTHHQRAGLELMEAMSSYQETAFERLCRWIQGEIKRLGNDDSLEIEPSLQKGAQALKDRPVLFKYCAKEVAALRHNALFQRFITALSKGGPNGLPRPIEMHAHDPKRYLGDMLAWVHQSLASEKDLLTSLFGSEDSLIESMHRHSENGVSSERESSGAELPRISLLLERVFDSICRPLKVRIEQVLLGTPPLLLCFQLSHLLSFYTNLVDKLLGNDATLTQTLASCRQLASRTFQEQLRASGEKLLRYLPQPPRDLSVPAQFMEAIQQVSDIVASFEASYDGEEGKAGEEEFGPVLSICLDPVLEAIQRSSQPLNPSASNRLDKGNMSSAMQHEYLINCFSAVEHVLQGHSICYTRSQEIQSRIQTHLTALVRTHTSRLMIDSGLAEIVDRIRMYTNGKAGEDSLMSQDPALPMQKIASALKSYVGQLSESHLQPEFRNLQVPRIRSIAVSQVSTTLANAYAFVYDNISNPASGYKEDSQLENVLKHSPDEIRTILGIV